MANTSASADAAGIEHVAYNVIMLRHTLDRIQTQTHQLDWNAFLEAFAVYARALYKFFRNDGQDAIRADSFTTSFKKGDLKGVDHLIQRIDRQVAHLSNKRFDEKNEKIGIPDAQRLAEWLETELARFLDAIDKSTHARFDNELQASNAYKQKMKESEETQKADIIEALRGPTSPSAPKK